MELLVAKVKVYYTFEITGRKYSKSYIHRDSAILLVLYRVVFYDRNPTNLFSLFRLISERWKLHERTGHVKNYAGIW